MGLIANQMAVEILCKMTEKLKRACIKNDNEPEKKIVTEMERNKNDESSKRNSF